MNNNQLYPLTTRELFISFLLAAIQMAHVLDFVIIMPLGPVLMENLKISPGEFGGLVSSYNYAAALCGFFMGLFADKFERKFILNSAFFLFILGTFGCGFAVDFESFLILRVLTGLAGGALNGLVLALITDFISLGVRGRAMGIVLSSFSVASVIGVPIGLAISDSFGWRAAFHFVAFFSLIIFVISLFYLPKVGNKSKKTTLSKFLNEYGKIILKKEYLYNYLFISLLAFSLFLMIPFLNPYAVKNMGIMQSQLKYMYLVGGILTVITARLFGVLTDKFGPHKVLTTIIFISIPPVLFYGHAGKTDFYIYLIIGSLFMAFVSGRMIPAMTLVSEIPSDEERGRFMAVMNSFRAFGVATSALISGFLISETEEKIIGHDNLSYYSIALSIIALLMSYKILFKGNQSK